MTFINLCLCYVIILIVISNCNECFARSHSQSQTLKSKRANSNSMNTMDRTVNLKSRKQGKDMVKIQCRDEAQNAVHWFIAYKLPKIRSSKKSTFRAGTGYSYILPGSNKWTESDKSVGEAGSVIGETLKPLFENLNRPELLSIIYNDQPSFRDDFGYNGHTKGVILGDDTSGIWLVHSVPKFPSVPPAPTVTRSGSFYNFYPPSGLNNAQLFLCLSLNSNQIDQLGNIFKLTRPHVNNSTLPTKLSRVYPTLKTFLETKRFSNRGPTSQIFNITVDELDFQIFAKSPKYDHEIYSEWLAPTLQSSLDVQSWLNGINAFTSNCSSKQFPVYNIRDKKVHGKDFGRNDHSKWAVGTEKSDPWTCVSDLNRMEGQKSRGGAALCIYNSKVWTAFNSAVMDLQPCPLIPPTRNA